jgi:hypothetical protein
MIAIGLLCYFLRVDNENSEGIEVSRLQLSILRGGQARGLHGEGGQLQPPLKQGRSLNKLQAFMQEGTCYFRSQISFRFTALN